MDSDYNGVDKIPIEDAISNGGDARRRSGGSWLFKNKDGRIFANVKMLCRETQKLEEFGKSGTQDQCLR